MTETAAISHSLGLRIRPAYEVNTGPVTGSFGEQFVTIRCLLKHQAVPFRENVTARSTVLVVQRIGRASPENVIARKPLNMGSSA